MDSSCWKHVVDLSRDAIALAKRYPMHTALCIRGGWEFCRPDQAKGESKENHDLEIVVGIS